MSEITTRAEIVPADPALPALAEVALAAYRAGVLDARPGPITVHYAPTFVYNVPALPGPGTATAVAFARPQRRRYSLAEVVFIAGRVLIAGGVLDLALCLVTGDVSYLLGLAPIGGALMTLGGAMGINREENAR